MKTTFAILLFGLLVLAMPDRGFADYGIANVSRADAKEMGVTLRTNLNGEAGIQVTMEFKTTGKLKEFARVEVRIGEGKDRVMSASLRESRSSDGSVAVSFSADAAYLSRSKLWLYVTEPLGGTIYQFSVKDFIGTEKAR